MFDKVHLAAIVAATICVGIVLHWALFVRLKMIFGAFGDRDEVRYRDLPNWHLLLTIVGSAMIGVSRASTDLLIIPFWLGVALFAAANVAGISSALRR
jgi:hypothetical protein